MLISVKKNTLSKTEEIGNHFQVDRAYILRRSGCQGVRHNPMNKCGYWLLRFMRQKHLEPK